MGLPSDFANTYTEEPKDLAGLLLNVIVGILVCLTTRIGFRNLFDIFAESKTSHHWILHKKIHNGLTNRM